MNYRHAFHAGSFADVVKHAVLVRILTHLRAKPAAFRVLDTHAGAGLNDLAGPEASRSPEWREGIARLLAAPVAEPARALIAPYLDAVAGLNPAGRLVTYPGSPALVLALLRPQDRLIACELEPNAAAALARHLGRDRRSKAIALDGWTALNAYVPPKERRGLVLIDPPFEDEGRFSAARPGAGGRAPQMAGRQLPAVVSDQGARGPRRPGAAAAALRDRQDSPRRDQHCRITRLEPPRRLRSDRGQPALDARKRARRAAAGAGDDPGGQGRRPPRRLARRRKLVSPLFHSLGLAYFRRAGFDVPPPVGAGGVTEALSSGRCLSPIANVQPSRRAVGSAAWQPRGREFPDGNGRCRQVLQCRAWVRLHQTG